MDLMMIKLFRNHFSILLLQSVRTDEKYTYGDNKVMKRENKERKLISSSVSWVNHCFNTYQYLTVRTEIIGYYGYPKSGEYFESSVPSSC